MSVGPFIGEKTVGEIAGTVHLIVEEFIKLPENPDKARTGGYLTIVDRDNGQLLLQVRIGAIQKLEDPDYGTKADKYCVLSAEKANRLVRYYRGQGHNSSWQSRDEKQKKYGGAIVAGNLIVSFSGLPERGDEVVVLILAYTMNWANFNDITTIAKQNENPLFDPFYQKHFPKG